MFFQLIKSGFFPGADQGNFGFKLLFHFRNIQFNSLAFHPISHIDRQYRRNTQIFDLSKKQKIALQIFNIAHHHDHIRIILMIPVHQQLDNDIFIQR